MATRQNTQRWKKISGGDFTGDLIPATTLFPCFIFYAIKLAYNLRVSKALRKAIH
uniref:Uncharacterized protein n=1 Tax=Heterorhabditis bacteriophora TaxID=37862 RepID=A0A1I7X5L4_HETBA